MKNAYIVGESVYLRGLEKEDLGGDMFAWANDSEVTHYMLMGYRPNQLETMISDYETMSQSPNDIVFAIMDKKTDKHIGVAGLHVIQWIARSAEFRIFIGDKSCWNKGFGKEVNQLLLDYGFNKLNLNKVWLGVNSENESAVKSYRNAGFVDEGVLRQEIYRNGKYYDAIRMSVLREEYEAKKA